MFGQTHYMGWTVVALAMVMLNPVLSDDNFRSAYVKLFEACSLTETFNQTTSDSDECIYACLAKRDWGKCAAYQWEAETRTCRLQETLNTTASSPGDTVGVLMDTVEPAACSDDTDCPLDHSCHVIDSASGTLPTMCIPDDCAAIIAANPCSQRESGVYSILAGTQHIHKVWCDMDTDGGGWTVFLKRQDGSVDFYQDLATYKQGFGDVNGEYWLGLDVLHAMTSAKSYQLRADISDWEGSSVYSLHQTMVVAGESDNYKLAVGELIAGEGGDALNRHSQMAFSTKDADRDTHTSHCAKKYGGFWYKGCLIANPTGKYYHGGAYTNTVHDGIQWKSWDAHKDQWYSMKTVELKLRP